MLTFDDYLEKRIQFGRSQCYTYGVLALPIFLNGFQVFYLIMILTLQQKEFNLTHTQLELLTSAQFCGMVLSYAIYSTMADKIGRKNLLMTGLLLLSFSLMLHGVATNIVLIGICRFLMGSCVGWLSGIPLIILVESVPAKIRGRMSTTAEVSYILGIIYMSISCYFAFDSYTHGNWRVVSQLNSLLALMSFILVLLKADESPRFHLVKGRYELAWIGMDKMGATNKRTLYVKLTLEEKGKLIKWHEALMQSQKHKPGYRALFGSGQKRITSLIWLLSGCLNILEKGVLILLPFVFASQDSSLITLVIIHSVELPAALVAGVFIDSKKYGGRIRGLQIGVLLLNISLMTLYLWSRSVVIFSFLLVRFSARWIASYYNPLVVETYSTLLRSTGSGAAQFIGKIVAAITPIIVMSIYFASGPGVFLFLLLVGFCCHIVLRLFPIDMTRQPLDLPKQAIPKPAPASMELEVSGTPSKEQFDDYMDIVSQKEL